MYRPRPLTDKLECHVCGKPAKWYDREFHATYVLGEALCDDCNSRLKNFIKPVDEAARGKERSMTDNKLDKYRLTDEEMAEVQGDKEACLAIIHGFDTCSGCSANCRAVADAQLSKLPPLLEEAKREGRAEVVEFINNLIIGIEGCKFEERFDGDKGCIVLDINENQWQSKLKSWNVSV